MAIEHWDRERQREREKNKKVDFSSSVQVTNNEREILENLKNTNIKMSKISSKFNQKHELHHEEKWLRKDKKQTEDKLTEESVLLY